MNTTDQILDAACAEAVALMRAMADEPERALSVATSCLSRATMVAAMVEIQGAE